MSKKFVQIAVVFKLKKMDLQRVKIKDLNVKIALKNSLLKIKINHKNYILLISKTKRF